MDKSPRKFFFFHGKMFYQKDGNLNMIKLGKAGAAKITTTNFNGQMQEIYMAHQESVYYKDKNHVLNFASLNILKSFKLKKANIRVFNCRGAF